jgi:hypothetical protein
LRLPTKNSPAERWRYALKSAKLELRTLPCGSSLAQFLAKNRGVRNRMALPPLTIEQILEWADAHHELKGQWPNINSGVIVGTTDEKWRDIDRALRRGFRGLPSGSSLARLIQEQRGDLSS